MLTPLPHRKWNYTTAAHLLNRAGFGGPPAEIEKLVKLGAQNAVSHFVDYEKIPDDAQPPEWAKPDAGLPARLREIRELAEKMRKTGDDAERKKIAEQQRESLQAERRQQIKQVFDLRGWWLRRMASTPRPLQEKLMLFWHGHFATSVEKVKYSYFMYLQNETLRKHAMGNWYDMLEAMAKDPAMLIWLDQAQSRRQHPNENFAREVMELFALGEGNYTEKDVSEAARALTGFSLDRETQSFTYRPYFHDTGTKSVLGHTGELTGEDVLKIIAEHPQSARFMAKKIWTFFAAEEPSPAIVEALADVFTKNGRKFAPMLRAMFLSQEFYAENVVRAQVKSPVQWLVGSVRTLEREMPEPLVASMMLKQLGQELFQPPNVKGWDGGLSWITTNNLLMRYNLATTLVSAKAPISSGGGSSQQFKFIEQRAREMLQKMPVVDVKKILSEKERTNKALLIPALEKRFLQAQLKDKQRGVLQDFLASRGELDDDDVRQAIRLIMATPEYQLT